MMLALLYVFSHTSSILTRCQRVFLFLAVDEARRVTVQFHHTLAIENHKQHLRGANKIEKRLAAENVSLLSEQVEVHESLWTAGECA